MSRLEVQTRRPIVVAYAAKALGNVCCPASCQEKPSLTFSFHYNRGKQPIYKAFVFTVLDFHAAVLLPASSYHYGHFQQESAGPVRG